jgi:hypothetical protein
MLTCAIHIYVQKADVLSYCPPYIGILQYIPLNIRQHIGQYIFTFKKVDVLPFSAWAIHRKQYIGQKIGQHMKSAYKAPVERQKFTTLANELGVMAVVASKDREKLDYCQLIASPASGTNKVECEGVGFYDQYTGDMSKVLQVNGITPAKVLRGKAQ